MKTKLTDDNYYPIIFWSEHDTRIVPPQLGGSDIRGYSDVFLWKILNDGDLGVQILRNCHLEVPCRAIPYKAAIALTDGTGKWFVDVEIDAPYHGWYRVPLHYVDGKDAVRDAYFNRCGWTVMRFTEQQVRKESAACLQLIRMVVRKLQGDVSDITSIVACEKRWTFKEAVAMERDLAREKYLDIQTFGQPEYLQNIRQRIRDKGFSSSDTSRPEIVFDEATHTYADIRNTTGTADYTSVTTLIEKFFPFFDEEASSPFLTKKLIFNDIWLNRAKVARRWFARC